MKVEKFGKITLINGDCMEYMRECKDKHFDVLVADPPYGDANFQNPPSEEIATGEGNCLAREARGLRNTSASHRIRSLRGRLKRYRKIRKGQSSMNFGSSVISRSLTSDGNHVAY